MNEFQHSVPVQCLTEFGNSVPVQCFNEFQHSALSGLKCAVQGQGGREGGRMTRQVTPFHFIGSRKERAAGEEQGREGRAEGAEHAVQGFVGKQEEDGQGRHEWREAAWKEEL